MRLIDADILYEEMMSEMAGTGYQSRALSVIKDAPTIDGEKNEPLTLEELRHMEGKPVVLSVGLVSSGEKLFSQWEILTDDDDDVFYFTRRMCGFSGKNYGKTWMTYRRKPRE